MTDRVRFLTVELTRDFRDDDVQEVVNAIAMIKGVSKVHSQVVSGPDVMARFTARTELGEKILEAVNKIVFDRNG